jgi:hypothetical protein
MDDVPKRLIGASVIDDRLDKGEALIAEIREFSQEYLPIGLDGAPTASFLCETRLEVISAK